MIDDPVTCNLLLLQSNIEFIDRGLFSIFDVQACVFVKTMCIVCIEFCVSCMRAIGSCLYHTLVQRAYAQARTRAHTRTRTHAHARARAYTHTLASLSLSLPLSLTPALTLLSLARSPYLVSFTAIRIQVMMIARLRASWTASIVHKPSSK
jgi:hypothetical protein